MDVITHTNSTSKRGTGVEPMTKPKPGPTESVPIPGRDRPRKHVHTDSMSFNEFHWGDFGVSFIATVAGFYTWG